MREPILPDHPSLDWLRKEAKTRLAELRHNNPGAKLADAQFDLAKQYGFASWRALKAHIDALTIDGQLIESARTGNVERLRALLNKYPDKLRMKVPRYEASLLFPAAQSGSIDAVDLLLERGLDVNYRESGDNTYGLHWVAAKGDRAILQPAGDGADPSIFRRLAFVSEQLTRGIGLRLGLRRTSQTIWIAGASYVCAMRIALVHLVRVLRRSPASAVAAILTLALTLGAGASIFAVVDAVLTPPPFDDPAALVTLGETPREAKTDAPRAVGYATLDAWRERARSLATIEAFDPTNLTLTGLGPAERTRATDVTPGFLPLLGASPILGRSFVPDDVGRPVVIVSAAFWSAKLNGDPRAIGREIVLGGETHTIVGVLSERFFFALDVSDIWRPLPMTRAQAARAGLRVRPVARLAPNVSPQSLATALDEISRRSTPPVRAAVTRIATAIAGGSTRTLGLLAGAAALAILIAFTNLAGLLIVRSIDRGRELAVRSALGARRMEIVRQLVLEAVAIVAAGTTAGVLLAFWLTPAVARLALQQFGGIAAREVIVSWRVMGAVSLLAAACACVCGLLPAVIASRRDVATILRRGATAAPRERWLRRAFVTAVVSCAFVLLVSVSLVGRSLMTVLAIDPGFEPSGVLTAGVAPPSARYPTAAQLVAFYSALESDVSQRLGARVGIIDELPLSNDRGRGLVSARPSDSAREAVIRVASTAYFDVMRIPVVAGRAFDRGDDASAPPRVVISESLAARLFQRESPIGRSISVDARAPSAEVIGVVRDVKHRSLDDPELPTLYLSMWQFPSRGSQLVLRATRSDRDAIAAVREAVRQLDGDLPVYGVNSMSNAVARSPGVPARRVLTAAFLGFAVLAVMLGAIGLFGVIAHEVAARRAELALRIALGANPSRILTSTLGQGMSIVASALIVGSVLSFWASRSLASVTNTSGSLDLVSTGAASGVLLLAGLLAIFPAARRAARTDPLTVLRGD
ncbi:MAG TPA: ABC transporter permease [Vicinamibacterales bacterium]|nr:ABC transporter permease [Vicinamibacterales bacterium]